MDDAGKTRDTWHKVERGIRYREHPTRKHGVPRRPDRYYVIRIAVDGLMRQEALGWESEGVTLDEARVELARLAARCHKPLTLRWAPFGV